MTKPYRSTPVFDADTLPAALRREHRTKPGVWGVIRVLEGEIELSFADGSPTEQLTPDSPGIVLPEQPHWVTPLGSIRMRVDFFDEPPTAAEIKLRGDTEAGCNRRSGDL